MPLNLLPLRNGRLVPFLFVLVSCLILAALAVLDLPPAGTILLGSALLASFLMRLRWAAPEEPNDPRHAGDSRAGSRRLLLGILAVSAFVRLVDVPGFFPWPTGDESENILIAWRWASEGWDGRWFHGFAQIPPGLHFPAAMAFQAFGASFASFWLVPALLSAFSVPFVHWASRRWLGGTAALAATVLYAFGIWPLLMGRYGVSAIPPVIVFAACMGSIGSLRGMPSRGTHAVHALAAGFLLGLGFLTYGAWPLTAVFLLFVAWRRVRKIPGSARALLLMILAATPGVLLFAVAAHVEGLGSHFRERSLLLSGASFPEWVRTSLGYLRVFLAGRPGFAADYAPLWGGLLNPLAASLFLEGFARLILRRCVGVSGWLAALLLVLPGLVSKGVEPFRVLPAFLAALAVAAVGLDALLRAIPSPRRRTIALFLVLSLLSGMDLYQLFGPYRAAGWSRDPRVAHMRQEKYTTAFLVLWERASREGPGRILSELHAKPSDPAFWLATSSLASRDPGPGRWTALFVNVHYKPFLEQRFPGLSWHSLAPKPGEGTGEGIALAVVPGIGDRGLGELSDRHEVLLGMSRDSAARANGTPLGPDLDRLERMMKEARDPLLVSALAEKILVAAFWEEQRIGPETDGHFRRMTREALETALKRGYPAAHLLNEYGKLLIVEGDVEGARRAWEKAVRCPVDFTPARLYLGSLPARREAEPTP